MSIKIVLVGGGTGGHFYPLIAVAEQLNESNISSAELYYFGPSSYNPEALSSAGIKYIYCPAGKKRRYRTFRNFLDIFVTFFGVIVAFFKLLYIYPDVIFSKGGYTSVPVTLAAWLLRIPIVIHESDAVPGRANRLVAPFARYIAITYDSTVKNFPVEKTAHVGIPTDKVFFEPLSSDAPKKLGIDPSRPLLFVTGGSQGSERINNLILNSLDELLPDYTIIHQTGTRHEEIVRQTSIGLVPDNTLLKRYHIRGHMSVDEFAMAIGLAALVISRAGSTTIYEIAIKGKPSILIPIPEDISHDQRTNAYTYARGGAASVMEEENLTDNLLVAEITRIMSDTKLYESMSGETKKFVILGASKKIADTLTSIGNEHT